MQKQSPKSTPPTGTRTQNRPARETKKPRPQARRARDTKQGTKQNQTNKGTRKARKKAKPHAKHKKKAPPRSAKRDNTMKNTSLGVWGAAMSGPRKNAAAVPPPEGVRGAGRSAPRDGRRGEAPSTTPTNSAYSHSILALLRRASRKELRALARHLLKQWPIGHCGQNPPPE